MSQNDQNGEEIKCGFNKMILNGVNGMKWP